eukprot:CAMPEP_0196654762 /NCGR_PEP_ID=MMETSP1086-20130531/4488_1 /TAXON_ID=77921 /ORGANISM="Cyanoptyche  gloeocystis , Strain SAG4.97" /LENGTH=35 /DNA_ID= /DNA_START= /DNA_END= /DNA_ORIENTATION=
MTSKEQQKNKQAKRKMGKQNGEPAFNPGPLWACKK